MTIWILAIVIIVSVALAGWRQGGIRASFAFAGIIFAALLAVPIGRLIHPLLPYVSVRGPIAGWALAPVFGFIIASIPLKIVGFKVNARVEHYYKYRAGELRLALFSRLNTRLGICVGLMNGAAYFVLVSFFVFNAAYWTTQSATASVTPPLTIRLVNSLGEGLQSSGFSRTAAGVGMLSPTYYKLADLTGLLMQNPQLSPRVAEYPGFTSLWHRGEMQSLVTDPLVTNSLASGTSLGEFMDIPSVHDSIANKDLVKMVLGTVTNNLSDFTEYLKTGQSSKYASEQILGDWAFNTGVTIAWLRQAQPKMSANELAAIRVLWSQAYGPATFLMTGDKQVFVKNWPKFMAQPQQGQPPFQAQDGQGDWSSDGTTYTVHFNCGGDDKYLTGTIVGGRLNLKDGRNALIFDHVD